MADSKSETQALFDQGLNLRREVLGAEYVDGSLARANDFMMAFQRITTEWCGDMPGPAQAWKGKPAACSTWPC